MQRFLYLFMLLTLATLASGQGSWHKQIYKHVDPGCYASDEVRKVFIPPPGADEIRLKSAQINARINVNYRDFPPEAMAAFDYAVGIWEQLLDSQVPVYIQAHWVTKDQNILGSCGPTHFERNFDGALQENIFYPIALAEKLSGTELTGPDRPDMIAEFNSEIPWYFGTDGDTPITMYDFVSIVLHEIGHGLGFTGFYTALDLTGGYHGWEWGDASAFDRLVMNNRGQHLIDSSLFENPSTELRSQLISNALYARSPVAVATGTGSNPRLYAPPEWIDGSSIYHLNDETYPSGNINTLMTHSYGRGEAIHHPGPLTLGIMADIGWKSMKFDHTPISDQEIVGPINFQVNITSDYPTDPSHVYLVYSFDSFNAHIDSTALINIGNDLYEVNILFPQETTSLQYFFSARDSMKRVFNSPAGRTEGSYSVKFGPDLIDPVINHDPIPFFFDTGMPLNLVATVTDNLGIDTVYIEYSINGNIQAPFGLTRANGSTFSGNFPIEPTQINDKDEFSYQIIAIDAAQSKNMASFPASDPASFLVEKMFEPVVSYSHDFESYKNDFILESFDIFTAAGFRSGALHSPHPYPSPDDNNKEYNFITILKHPIILNDDATMLFNEVVLVEPGSENTSYGDIEFWDYVIVEGSKDNGNSWLPIADGYDSRAHASWEEIFYSSIANENSTSTGSPDLYIQREINMLENGNFSSGDTLLIRFRLYSDPYAHGWGWAIDDLNIQSPVSVVSNTILSPGNFMVYPNPFSNSFMVASEANQLINLLEFELYNMHGQKINSVRLQNISGPVTTEMNIANGGLGIYLLVVKENGKQVLSKKMIHNKN